MCSVPMCLCVRRSDSSAAAFSARLDSSEKGRSTEVETFSRISVRPSISLRMLSIEAFALGKKRLVRFLSSRISPRRRCSVSMYGLPNWLAS